MNVIVFGATGSVGALTVRQLLDDGARVTAFSRHPEKLGEETPRLRLVAGDVFDPDAVKRAMAGHNAAIVVLGAGASRTSKVRSVGTMNVIRGMQAHGIKRLICQSTLGAHESWKMLNIFWKRIMFGLLLRPAFLDHELQELLVRASGLDWTIVRPSAFTDSPATGAFQEAFTTKTAIKTLKIARADVAAFLKRQLTDMRYAHRAVSISN